MRITIYIPTCFTIGILMIMKNNYLPIFQQLFKYVCESRIILFDLKAVNMLMTIIVVFLFF
jgi:hypothetical protein